MSSKISDFFVNEGHIFNLKKNNSNFSKLNIRKIQQTFKLKGIIIFRNLNLDKKNILKFINNFSYSYSNDAIRRSKRLGSDYIRDVDAGNQRIDLHSEASFSPSWPEIIWFYCINPAKKSGKTLLCDGVKLWNSLALDTKNFFLSTQIKYKLKIPYLIKKDKIKKKWYLPYQGIQECMIDFKSGIIEIDFNKYVVHQSRMPTKDLAFANHLFVSLDSEPQLITRTTYNGKKIPKKIMNEINKKSRQLTCKIMLKKNDLVMIDNYRFMHGREKIFSNEKRDIINVQTLSSKI